MSQELIRIGGAHCGRDGSPYHPVKGLLSATNTALLLGAPLFLAGEPGCGKTDFAWYAAKALAQFQKKADCEQAIPLQCYVHSDTRAKDLLYHYDTLARFADAHESQSQKEARDPRRYIELRALGLALMARTQKVILIDEIDKAPRDLPNDLLRELDQGHFEIPDIPEHIAGTYADRSDPDILLARHMISSPKRRWDHAAKATCDRGLECRATASRGLFATLCVLLHQVSAEGRLGEDPLGTLRKCGWKAAAARNCTQRAVP